MKGNHKGRFARWAGIRRFVGQYAAQAILLIGVGLAAVLWSPAGAPQRMTDHRIVQAVKALQDRPEGQLVVQLKTQRSVIVVVFLSVVLLCVVVCVAISCWSEQLKMDWLRWQEADCLRRREALYRQLSNHINNANDKEGFYLRQWGKYEAWINACLAHERASIVRNYKEDCSS